MDGNSYVLTPMSMVKPDCSVDAGEVGVQRLSFREMGRIDKYVM